MWLRLHKLPIAISVAKTRAQSLVTAQRIIKVSETGKELQSTQRSTHLNANRTRIDAEET